MMCVLWLYFFFCVTRFCLSRGGGGRGNVCGLIWSEVRYTHFVYEWPRIGSAAADGSAEAFPTTTIIGLGDLEVKKYRCRRLSLERRLTAAFRAVAGTGRPSVGRVDR